MSDQPKRRYRKKKEKPQQSNGNTAASVDEDCDDDDDTHETGFVSFNKNGKVNESKAMKSIKKPRTGATKNSAEFKAKGKGTSLNNDEKKSLKEAVKKDYRSQTEYAAVVAAMNTAANLHLGYGSPGFTFEPAILLHPPKDDDDPKAIAIRKGLTAFDDEIKREIQTTLETNEAVGVVHLIAAACHNEEDVAVVASVLPPSTGALTADLKTTSEVEICMDVGYTVPDGEQNIDVAKNEGVKIDIPEHAIKRELRPYFKGDVPELNECLAMIKSVHIQNTFNSFLYAGGNTHIGVRALVPARGELMRGMYQTDLAIFNQDLQRPTFARLTTHAEQNLDDDETVRAYREQIKELTIASAKVGLKQTKKKKSQNAVREGYETLRKRIEEALARYITKQKKMLSKKAKISEEKTKAFYGVSQADALELEGGSRKGRKNQTKGVVPGLLKVWPLVNPPGTGVDATCKCLYKNDVMEVLRSGGAELSDFQALSAWARTQWTHELHLEMYRFLTSPSESRCVEHRSPQETLTGLSMDKTGRAFSHSEVIDGAVADKDGSLSKAYEWYCTQLPGPADPIVFAMKDPKDKSRVRRRQNPLALFAAVMAPAIIQSQMQRMKEGEMGSQISHYLDLVTGVLRLPRKVFYQKISELADLHQLADTIIPLNDLNLLLLPTENAFIPASVNAAKKPYNATRGSFSTQVKLKFIMVEPTIPAERIAQLKDEKAMQAARVESSLTQQLKNIKQKAAKDAKEQTLHVDSKVTATALDKAYTAVTVEQAAVNAATTVAANTVAATAEVASKIASGAAPIK
jgi:hypothetical protein